MSKYPGKYIIGLTGNIATGKRDVCKALTKLGTFVLDVDTLSQRLIDFNAPGYQPIIDFFGADILNTEREIDREKLITLAAEKSEFRTTVATILNPLIDKAVEAAIKHSSTKTVVIKGNNLLESPLRDKCNAIWVTTASEQKRLTRLMKRHYLSEADAGRRLGSLQQHDKKFTSVDLVIDTNSTSGAIYRQVTEAWKKFDGVPEDTGVPEKMDIPERTGKGVSFVRALPEREAVRTISFEKPSKDVKIETTDFPQNWKSRVNWPLFFGFVLVLLVSVLAIVGPSIAPNDPLQENLLVKDPNGKWHIPPFSAFVVPGFPLGSDEFGRDLYSRLLWAIRPTLQMVVVIATVRLVLGTLIGLAAGWSTGRMGRLFDTLISSALALPGLLVALGAIAVIGVELGVLAFIIGLSLTGWAETARLVREQTRSIRSQLFIEAARAIGSSELEIVFRHVLRQITAMIWMLLAFEIGATLMLTAGLGFLGYYIGGDVWVDVDDFVARRVSGAPELGQMLATAWVRTTEPWGLVAVGSVVFFTVLGFNLVGEGLRLRLSPETQIGRIKWLNEYTSRFRLWLDERLYYPISQRFLQQRTSLAMTMFILGMIFGLGVAWTWDQPWFQMFKAQVTVMARQGQVPLLSDEVETSSTEPSPSTKNAVATQTIPTSEIQNTNDSPSEEERTALGSTKNILVNAPERGWIVDLPEPLVIHPIVHSDGSIYVITEANKVYVLSPEGAVQNTMSIPNPVHIVEDYGFGGTPYEIPFTPIVAQDGSIVFVSSERIYALTLDGTVRWEIVLDDVPFSPPVYGFDEDVLYQIDQLGTLYAISPSDGLLWKHDIEDGLKAASPAPVFSPKGEIFYTITNGTKGMIEAISPDGIHLWRVDLKTFKFFRPIEITPTGKWLAVADNAVNTATGSLVEPENIDFKIDQFIIGRDGKTYLLSGRTIMEWEIGSNGFSITDQISVNFPSTARLGVPPSMTVSKDRIFWLQVYTTGGGLSNMWINGDGEVKGLIDVSFREEFILDIDIDNTKLSVCTPDRNNNLVSCRGYEVGSNDPVWQISIEGVGHPESIQYKRGVFYIQVENNAIQTINVEIPE